MNRIAVVVVTLAVVAGSVPAAATLAGPQATAEGGPAPGAAFAGVVDVQQVEVDSEVAGRALERRFAAAESNGSKAAIVAGQEAELSERLDELEAEKARLERAYENGSISRGQYQAQLAALAAQLRAVERRANQTADVAESLPDPVLREHGTNASQVRAVAQHANRTGGGAVAEAAREIAGEGVGNGLGPPNGTARGPPESAGPPSGNGSGDDTGPPEDVGPNRDGNATGADFSADVGRNVTGPGNVTGGPPTATAPDQRPQDAGNGTVSGPDDRTAPGQGAADDPGSGNATDPGNDSAAGSDTPGDGPPNGSDAGAVTTDGPGTGSDGGSAVEGDETATPTETA